MSDPLADLLAALSVVTAQQNHIQLIKMNQPTLDRLIHYSLLTSDTLPSVPSLLDHVTGIPIHINSDLADSEVELQIKIASADRPTNQEREKQE